MKYVTEPVLVRRKRNVTGSLSFGRQIGFRFTVFNTTSKASDVFAFVRFSLETVIPHLPDLNGTM